MSCELSAQPMQAASAWMSRYEKFWTEKLDSLARYLYQQEELQTWNKPALAEKPSLALRRYYPVAPEKVWRAWTDPQALKQLVGPGGPTSRSRSPSSMCASAVAFASSSAARTARSTSARHLQEVTPPRRLSFTWHWPNTTPERVSLVTITFDAAGGGTQLEFRHEQLFDEQARDGHKRGWSEALASWTVPEDPDYDHVRRWIRRSGTEEEARRLPKMARKMAKIMRDHGALEYRECIADDVKPGKWTSFPQAVKLKKDEVVWFSWIVYKNRKHRDRVFARR